MINPRTPFDVPAGAHAPNYDRAPARRGRSLRSIAFVVIAAVTVATGVFTVQTSAGATTQTAADATTAAVHTCNGHRATIVGTSRSETLIGTARADVIWAGEGNDTIRARGGSDTVCGGRGNDRIFGDAGGDWLDGSAGFDRLNGGDGTGDRCTAAEIRTKCERMPRFATLAPGARLPSGAVCARNVRRAAENRPGNTTYNRRRGTSSNGRFPRVNGNYVGTTDQILQWTACKWGINERIVRAQTAKESWWHQWVGGDMTTNQNNCHPLLRTSSGPCPESIGLLQVRYQYHREAFEDANAIRSSAYNSDYTYASWRACYEGKYTWLNQVERGATYAKGDAWGCLGVWFAGRWRTPAANQYIANVSDYYRRRVWAQGGFSVSGLGGAGAAEGATPVAAADEGQAGFAGTATAHPHHGAAAATSGAAASHLPSVVPSAARATCRGRVATIVGNSGNNLLKGTRRADVIVGGGGNDIIRSSAGNDVICGGNGHDRIDASSGRDAVYAGAGIDYVTGGTSDDIVAGDSGNDFLYGRRGDDRIGGGTGHDLLVGGDQRDLLTGGKGSDRYTGGAGRDTVRRDAADRWFVEQFDSRRALNRFAWFIHNAANFFSRPSHWNGDHNDHCGGPTTYRDVFFRDAGVGTHLGRKRGELAWWCAPLGPGSGHMMTSFNTGGYGQVDFSPDRTFKRLRRVCWTQNMTNLGTRKWTQMVVVPNDVFRLHNKRLDYVVPRLEDGPGSAGLKLGGDIFMLEMVQGTTVTHVGRHEWADYRGFATLDKARRYKTCVVDLENGNVRIELERENSTQVRTMRGAFPNGTVRVILQDDNYNPTKDRSPVQYPFTWHWDNITIR